MEQLRYWRVVLALCLHFVVYLNAQELVQERDCKSADLKQTHGEVWLKNCEKCTCQNGSISCSPIVCPADEELPCPNPERVFRTDCCKSCPRRNSRSKKAKIERICVKDVRETHRIEHRMRKQRGLYKKNRKVSRRTRRARRRRKHKRGRRISKKKHRNTKMRASPNRPPIMYMYPQREQDPVPAFFDGMCIPKKAYYLIYKHIEQSEMFVALENLRKNMVEVWHWNLTKTACESVAGNPERCSEGSGRIHLLNKTIFIYPSEEFRKQVTREMLFAAATGGEVQKFKDRLTKSVEECEQKSIDRNDNRCRVIMIPRAFINLNIVKPKAKSKSKRRRKSRARDDDDNERYPQGMSLHKVKENCHICQKT